jgi:hypothetical protein
MRNLFAAKSFSDCLWRKFFGFFVVWLGERKPTQAKIFENFRKIGPKNSLFWPWKLLQIEPWNAKLEPNFFLSLLVEVSGCNSKGLLNGPLLRLKTFFRPTLRFLAHFESFKKILEYFMTDLKICIFEIRRAANCCDV